jgi:hypothetical protein
MQGGPHNSEPTYLHAMAIFYVVTNLIPCSLLAAAVVCHRGGSTISETVCITVIVYVLENYFDVICEEQ